MIDKMPIFELGKRLAKVQKLLELPVVTCLPKSQKHVTLLCSLWESAITVVPFLTPKRVELKVVVPLVQDLRRYFD